jgi:hypothetical protein
MIEEILSTKFARKAIETTLICQENKPCAANVFRCLLEEIDRMAKSCQLTEFTDHGLPHLLSLVKRIDTWTIKDGSYLITTISNDETCLLFFAVIIHDIGMLSQNESDLNHGDRVVYARQFSDLSAWVRRTHTLRIEGITRRILENEKYKDFCATSYFKITCELARSHNYWPDSKEFIVLSSLNDKYRLKSLAGILAVADLLDEDSNRCDSMTLFANKIGTLLNRAHWLRHILTSNCLKIEKGIIKVHFQEPNNLKGKIKGAFIGLENHLNQCKRYNRVLSKLDAKVSFKFFKPVSCNSLPDNVDELSMLCCQPNVHLLRTFENETLPAATNAKPEGTRVNIKGIKMQTVDRRIFDTATGKNEIDFIPTHTDYEITYLASLLSGEESRQSAAKIMRKVAWRLHERGNIIGNRRLSSFVVEETIKLREKTNNSLIDDNIYWAAVFLIHWADGKANFFRVSSLFDHISSMRGNVELNKLMKGLSLPWKVIALACYFILHRPSVLSLSFVDQIIDEQVNEGASIEPEVALAWYDLIESLWGLGYFNVDSQGFWYKFRKIQRLEKDEVNSTLKELAWRMSVQSKCLKGLNRWQFVDLKTDRAQYDLKHELAREAIAQFWLSWFNYHKFDTKKVVASNPKGSEFYISGLEAESVSVINEDPFVFQDFYSIRKKLQEAKENDQSYEILRKMNTELLSETHDPKDNETTYLYKRKVETINTQFFIGERVVLRRWFLEGWRNLVHTNVQRILNSAYALALEDEDVSEAIAFCLSEIAWGSLDGDAIKKIGMILDMNDTKFSCDKRHTLTKQILNCPPRICSINHPGLILLGDTIDPEFIPQLIDLTQRRINTNTTFYAKDYTLWNDILPYVELSHEQWYFLNGLVVRCLSGYQNSDSKQIVSAFFQLAPWNQVCVILEKIFASFDLGDIDPDWFLEVKDGIVADIINRQDRSWHGSPQIKKLVSILRNGNDRIRVDNDDLLLAEWLETPKAEHVGPQYENLAISMVEKIEKIAACAVSRKSNKSYSFGGRCAHVLAKLPPVSDQLANRAAEALNRIWNARFPTLDEFEDACLLAIYILKASSSEGAIVLLNAFFTGMESVKQARYIGGEKDGSESPWKYISHSLDMIPDSLIDKLYRLVFCRIIDLPVHSAGALASCLIEIAMRSIELEIRKSAYTMLFSVRIKTSNHMKYNSSSFALAVNRYVENIKKGCFNEDIFLFLIAWSKEAVINPDINCRYDVAIALKKLLSLCDNKNKADLEMVIESLKTDPHLKIRNVFR